MELLKAFVHSKRAQGVLASILVFLLGEKVGMSEDTANKVAGALLVLVAAIAAGDFGKEAKKIEKGVTS